MADATVTLRRAPDYTAAHRNGSPPDDAESFMNLASLFREAALTDEPHAHSGESDRLLRIAADMATFFVEGKTLESSSENFAYDLAALVRAARLVPGDTELAERRALLNRAGAILAKLTQTGIDVIEPPADRPALKCAHGNATTAASPDVAAPISLDTYHVQNWDSDNISAILNPQAGTHAKLAWCYGQVKEMHDLLWGYISLPADLPSSAVHEMAEAMLAFVEQRMTPLLGLLEVMCEQSLQQDRDAGHQLKKAKEAHHG